MATLDPLRKAKIDSLLPCSPELVAALPDDLWPQDSHPHDLYYAALVIGQTIARKRHPIPQAELRSFFRRLEELLKDDDPETVDAATGVLRGIDIACQQSGFDLTTIQPLLGPCASSYLASWQSLPE